MKRVDRVVVQLLCDDGSVRQIARSRITGVDRPVTGDWAVLGAGSAELLGRTTTLKRGRESQAGGQVVAANVDLVLLALDRESGDRAGLIERLS